MGMLSLNRQVEPMHLNTDRFVPGRQYVVFNRFDGNYLVLSLKGTIPSGRTQDLLNSPSLHEVCKTIGKPVSLSNDDSFFVKDTCLDGLCETKWGLTVYPHKVNDKTYWTLHYL